ncbi:MAG: hypothetical protein MIO90_01820 [Methanomassiliicoccales archaeon]|nr:hypothetical protein [Methanomassiliicoccales archaeon]
MKFRRGCLGNEGVGGFLESILAVMAVITASSLFLVMLSVGAVQSADDEMDIGGLLDELQDQGLWPCDGGRLDAGSMESRFTTLIVPEGMSVRITYRGMGEQAPFLTLGDLPPNDAVVSSEREPVLMEVDGRAVPAVAEVLVW